VITRKISREKRRRKIEFETEQEERKDQIRNRTREEEEHVHLFEATKKRSSETNNEALLQAPPFESPNQTEVRS
jgi:hypothetical protein